MAFQEVIDAKQRIIQEFVPGKQVTIAHVIANPKPDLFRKMGLEEKGRNAIGILTITPGEGTIIAADIAAVFVPMRQSVRRFRSWLSRLRPALRGRSGSR